MPSFLVPGDERVESPTKVPRAAVGRCRGRPSGEPTPTVSRESPATRCNKVVAPSWLWSDRVEPAAGRTTSEPHAREPPSQGREAALRRVRPGGYRRAHRVGLPLRSAGRIY